MLFRKRDRRRAVSAAQRRDDGALPDEQQLFAIPIDAMLKGAYFRRGGKQIRQFSVTVDGATRLVTSGDLVDKATYDALLAAGAIKASPSSATDTEVPNLAGK